MTAPWWAADGGGVLHDGANIEHGRSRHPHKNLTVSRLKGRVKWDSLVLSCRGRRAEGRGGGQQALANSYSPRVVDESPACRLLPGPP